MSYTEFALHFESYSASTITTSISRIYFFPLIPRHFDLESLSSLIPKSHEKLIERNMTRLQ